MVPKKIIVLVFVSVVLVIIISSLIYINIIQFLNSNQWAAQTYQVLNQIEIVYSDIKDIETGARGYIITGNDTYLYSYNDIGKILMPDLSTLKNFIIADKSPIRSYTSLEDLINDQLKLQEKLIKLRRSGGYSQNDVLITEEVGKSKMDEIRNAVNGMKSAENDLLTDRLKQRAARTFGLFGVTTILVILLIAAIIFTIYLFK